MAIRVDFGTFSGNKFQMWWPAYETP